MAVTPAAIGTRLRDAGSALRDRFGNVVYSIDKGGNLYARSFP